MTHYPKMSIRMILYLVGITPGKFNQNEVQDEEPSVFNLLTKEGRAKYAENINKNPKGTFFGFIAGFRKEKYSEKGVPGAGFEPAKLYAEDLESTPFDRSGTPACCCA